MMFKKILATIIIFILIFNAGMQIVQNVHAQTTKDILLLYGGNLNVIQSRNVTEIADLLAYMGYSIEPGEADKNISKMKDYQYIVLYGEELEMSLQFLDELSSLKSKVLIIGSSDITQLASKMHLDINCTLYKSTTAKIAYVFDNGRQVSELTEQIDVTLLNGKYTYRRGELSSNGKNAPLCAGVGRFLFIPVFNSRSQVDRAILAEQIMLWRWPYKNLPQGYSQYIVFEEIYPFMDNKKLQEVVDLMKRFGLPYVITVSPIYQNGNYPAMKHFCEVLKYAQANGGAVFLKLPRINTGSPTLEDINKHINIGVTAYTSYGVYPMGLVLPKEWIHTKLGQQIIQRFSTVVLTEEQAQIKPRNEKDLSKLYTESHRFIAPAITMGAVEDNLVRAYPNAIFLDMGGDIDELTKQMDKIRATAVPLKSIWATNHTVYTDDKVINYDNNVLTLNGRTQSLRFIPFEYQADFDYKRGVIGKLAESFARENKRLLFIVVGISVLFIIFIVIARYQNRSRFLIKNYSDKDKED